MRKLRKNGKNKLIGCFLLFFFFSCNSLNNDEYEILNLALNRCVFKEMDPEEISKVASQKKVTYADAMNIVENKMNEQQYTFTISDTLYAVDLPENILESLHNHYIFNEIQGRSDQSIPIDFSKIKDLKNKKRLKNVVNDKNYLGYFKFHRVLFDKSKRRAYIQVDLPRGRSGFGSIGLRLKKENGKWEIEK